jgi:arylsulfatase A-like enzyme
MIVADDTTPSYHGCYGGPTPTPGIDRLAREGVKFARGYCAASLCCPSRWTLFTGQYAGRSASACETAAAGDVCRVDQNAMLAEGTPTLAKALGAAGYRTGHVGKWHSRFDTDFMGVEEPVIPKGDPDEAAVDAELRRRQAVAQEVVRRCGGFEVADRVNWGNIGDCDPKIRAHNPAWLTDGALAFLEDSAGDRRPFYLHLAHSVPHAPDCQLSLGMDHRYTWSGKLAEAPSSHPADETVLERLRAAGLQTAGPIAGVNAGQVMLDDSVVAVLEKLDALGLTENTIVVYTADHGVPGKGSCYVTGQHLPLVVRWPAGLPAGGVAHGIASWVDVVPTLAEACGAAMPEGHVLDGVSLLGALRGEGAWPREVAYHEMGWSRSVMKGRYHYIATRYPKAVIEAWRAGEDGPKPGIGVMFDRLNAPHLPGYFDPDQLYDLATDPFERVNLVGDPTRAAVVADLKAELGRITGGMPRPFPSEADAFLASEKYQGMLAERRAEMAAIRHYPTGDVPRIWFANLHDPDAAD